MDTDMDFFKMITDRVADEGILKLPPGSSQRMRDLPENIVLRDCYKNVWPVKISKKEADWCFDGGWMQLYNDKALQVLDCVQFEYRGGNIFDIRIIGSDGCDKEDVGGLEFVVEEFEEVDLEDQEAEHVQRDQAEEGLQRFEDQGVQDVDGSSEEETSVECSSETDGHHKVNHVQDTDASGASGSRLNVTRFGIGTIPRTRNYKKTKNPDCYADDIFTLGLLPRPTNPYFVSRYRARTKPHLLHIPHQVIRDHNLNIPATFCMIDEKGERWSSRIRQWHDGRVTCSEGWTDLCKANGIEVNTVCIFEFVQGKDQDFCIKVQQLRK